MEGTQYAGFGSTQRRDTWWAGPLATALGLSIFGVYSTWAAFQGDHYEYGPYLSPFYSPLILVNWWSFSPAFLILWAPLGFRATCYYYRKAYYRSFFVSPPACSVQGLGRKIRYTGETAFPFILQNVHRMFLYFALILNVILAIDAFKAFFFAGTFGMGLGSIVLSANAFLLAGYSLSCHCFRHLMGGNIDCFSTAHLGTLRYKIWSKVSVLNEHHMKWAWTSLFMVGFADLYVRLCSLGIWADIRFF